MKKPFELKEFDIIVGNSKYDNQDTKYKYLEEPKFTQLLTFIKEYTNLDETSHASEFMKIGWNKGVGDTVTINNYVGLIQMKDGYQIQILPKISLSTLDEDNIQTKRIFIDMLRCMKEFKSKTFNLANLNISNMNIYEIFIAMYLDEVNTLVKKGLKSMYIQTEDNLMKLKGKIAIKNQIKLNFAHKEKFYVEFEEFQINRAENKLIKSTLLKLLSISDSNKNKRTINRLLTNFELVSSSVNFDADFLGIKTDRSMKDYEQILKWSMIFLKNKSFTMFSGNSVSKALLFPMEKLFEAFVTNHVKKILTPKGYSVFIQDKGYYLFDEPTNKFALRPDIVIKKNNKIIILDTKWKEIHNTPRDNYGISQQDMYQMYAYSKKYEANECNPIVWLLYPYNKTAKEIKELSFKSEDGVIVNIYFIKLDEIENNIIELEKKFDLITKEVYK